MKVRCNQHGPFRSVLVEQAYQAFRFFGLSPSLLDLFVRLVGLL
jgi:hypothetical protein